MAERPVFLPSRQPSRLVDEVSIPFVWNRGMAESQKRKNIKALHDSAREQGLSPLLEVSTKSEDQIGRYLSAFNLGVVMDDGSETTLECAFQGSKVFEKGGPYTDLYFVSSLKAKRDPRLRDSGQLTCFRFQGVEFPVLPKTGFYDWLYLRAISCYPKYLSAIRTYTGFTDIEFNPTRSINCQARSCAIAVSLERKGPLAVFLEAPSRLFEALRIQEAESTPSEESLNQMRLFTEF
jgi:hypothetical protein